MFHVERWTLAGVHASDIVVLDERVGLPVDGDVLPGSCAEFDDGTRRDAAGGGSAGLDVEDAGSCGDDGALSGNAFVGAFFGVLGFGGDDDATGGDGFLDGVWFDEDAVSGGSEHRWLG